MKLKLNDNFCEMTQEDMLETEGGVDPVTVVGLIIVLALVVCGTKGCADAEAGK